MYELNKFSTSTSPRRLKLLVSRKFHTTWSFRLTFPRGVISFQFSDIASIFHWNAENTVYAPMSMYQLHRCSTGLKLRLRYISSNRSTPGTSVHSIFWRVGAQERETHAVEKRKLFASLFNEDLKRMWESEKKEREREGRREEKDKSKRIPNRRLYALSTDKVFQYLRGYRTLCTIRAVYTLIAVRHPWRDIIF